MLPIGKVQHQQKTVKKREKEKEVVREGTKRRRGEPRASLKLGLISNYTFSVYFTFIEDSWSRSGGGRKNEISKK